LSNLRFFQNDIQGDFEGYADISTCDRTPQKVTIEPIIPYTNVEIYREKGDPKFFKKRLGATKLLKKWVKKTFFCFNSKLNHFDINLNLNLNHKWVSPTWRKPI
jgi:hypothetical protein